MPALLAAGGGFLLGVLWMDLLFDVQVFATAPDAGIASIAAYYRRVTTEAYPMNRVIAAVMLLTVAGAAYRLARGRVPRGPGLAALGLVAVAVGLALVRVVPNAVRLGSEVEPAAVQLALARAIAFDHLFCLAAMLAFVTTVVVTSGRTP